MIRAGHTVPKSIIQIIAKGMIEEDELADHDETL